MGERVKDVYVMWEICEKEVYVMRDMKDVYVMTVVSSKTGIICRQAITSVL